MPDLKPQSDLVDRFAADLDALAETGARIGIAVSGGPDSLALLLLAAAARPGLIEAATVDHGLRPESRAEAEMVAGLCARLDVPHAILAIHGLDPNDTGLQAKARAARYDALAAWAREGGIDGIATAHHLDDQAETLAMRLARGSGVRGLAGMRSSSRVPATVDMQLLRPLLGWRRSELEAICAAAGVRPADDPSNRDMGFERVRVRRALAQADWLEPEALARSAANLAAADEALDWTTGDQWTRQVEQSDGEIRYRPTNAPAEIRRRTVARALDALATEGGGPLRGRELDHLLAELEAGRTATLRGVRCAGGETWRFTRAAPRR